MSRRKGRKREIHYTYACHLREKKRKTSEKKSRKGKHISPRTFFSSKKAPKILIPFTQRKKNLVLDKKGGR